ncbi:MAG TPA: Gfo/Idh/MocA family oxidoreductase [Terriglobales bacterium]|nr:Gfo/Idh/MocA family oxidoreductase [Terriglobales bacterium]
MSDFIEKYLTRRKFLGNMGKGLAATGVAGSLWNSSFAQDIKVPEPPGKKLGYAIVGLGRLSIFQLLPAFDQCEKSRLVAFVSGHPDKAQKLAKRYGVDPKNIYNYENYDKLKDNPDVDIIYVVLPNSMHKEYTIRGLQAGKHVLCEKPMANSVADCQAMVDAAKQVNRKLMIAYRVHYEPYNQEMARLARSKELGTLKVIEADTGFKIGDPTQWRLKKDMAGGGSLMDIGLYSLNGTRLVAGEEPTEINAMMYSTPGDPRFKEVEETVMFQLRFPSGLIANCSSSYGYSGQNRLRAVTDNGWFELEPSMQYTGLRMRVSRGNRLEEVTLRQVDHFAAEMDHMSDCVMNNKTPLTPGEEGLQDVKLMMAIYEAAKTSRTVKV